MVTDLYLFLLQHQDTGQIRHELIYGLRSLKDAHYQISVVWPSYWAQCLRIAQGINNAFWHEYLRMSDFVRILGQQDRKTLIIGDPVQRRWGIAYRNPRGNLAVHSKSYPLPALEFRLDDTTAYAAFEEHRFERVEAKAYMPKFVSFWGDSLT